MQLRFNVCFPLASGPGKPKPKTLSPLTLKLSEGSLPSSDKPRKLGGLTARAHGRKADRGEVRVKPHLLDRRRSSHKPCAPLREILWGAGHTGPPLLRKYISEPICSALLLLSFFAAAAGLSLGPPEP